MQNSDTIGEVIKENQTLLCSKLSIAILGFFFSPILSNYLYFNNLRRTEQKEKITSFFIVIVIFNFFALVPFLGFNIYWNGANPLLYIRNILVTLVMVFPFWTNHFGEKKIRRVFSS